MIDLDKISEYPDELVKQLGLNDQKKMDIFIYSFIKQNGPVTINQILIHIYESKQIVMKRTTLVGKIYRLARRGLVQPHAGKKGVYAAAKREDIKSDGGKQ